MPDTPTSRLKLYKSASDGSELVTYTQDIGQNLDKIDLAVGALACTSSTRPSAPWSGQLIRETDTGRLWVSNGSSPASGSWSEITTPGTAQTFTGAFTISGQSMVIERASATSNAYRARQTGDAASRFLINADGSMVWGTGAGTGDTNLYRSGANTLATDDALSVAGNLTVSGTINLTSVFVEDTTTRTTTSVNPTFSNSSGTLSATITVPASGRVWVDLRSTQRNSGTNNTITSFLAVGSVSGTNYSPNATAALISPGAVFGASNNICLTLRHRLTGLTPGETLTVTMQHCVNSASTATMDYRSIALQACAS